MKLIVLYSTTFLYLNHKSAVPFINTLHAYNCTTVIGSVYVVIIDAVGCQRFP